MTHRTTANQSRAAYRRRVAKRRAVDARAPRVQGRGYSPELPEVTDLALVADAPQGLVSAGAYRAAQVEADGALDPDRAAGPADGSAGAPRRLDTLPAPYRSPAGTSRSAFTGARSAVTGTSGSHRPATPPPSRPIGSVGPGDAAPVRSVSAGYGGRAPVRESSRLAPNISTRAAKRARWNLARRAHPYALNPLRAARRADIVRARAALASSPVQVPEASRRVRRKATAPLAGARLLTRTDPARTWRALRPLAPFVR